MKQIFSFAFLTLLALGLVLPGVSISTQAQDNPTVTPETASGEPTPSALPTTTIHVVQRGENLFRIALMYGTTVEAIAEANGLSNTTMISVGQRLIIPNAQPSVPGVPTAYIVGPEDSLFNLSLRYGMTINEIARINKIVTPSGLFVGLRLALQEGAERPSIKKGWLHTVQADDNLYRIATRYGKSVKELAKANHLKREAFIYPGQRIVIPGAETEETPALPDVPQPFTGIHLAPAPTEQGRTIFLRITTAIPVNVIGTFLNVPLQVFADETRTTHTIFYGIHSLAQPGIYPLVLRAIEDSGKETLFSRNIEVIDGGYLKESINIDPSVGDVLNPAITQPESEQVLALVKNITPTRHFAGQMGLPCPAPVTSQFGTRRSYNGGPFDQIHNGTDFGGPPESAIFAPAAGTVVFAGGLTVRGNATIIDHGWGIYTGYWHQDKINVKVGDFVQQGQPIGTVGKTGRVTGYHLHWELFVNGVQVDPLQWVRQSFP